MGVFNALVSGSFLPWKRASRETDYETVLARLEREIQEVQSRLTQIRIRERRASVTLTLQAFLLWALYTAACWFLGLLSPGGKKTYLSPDDSPNRSRIVGPKTLMVWTPVLGSPIFIVFTRRIVKWWYRRIGEAEEKHLIDLKRQKREKIDEIKKATKYDHLRMLLERYDEGAAKPMPPISTPDKKNVSKSSSPKSSPQQPSPAIATPQKGLPAPNTPEAQALQAQRMALMRQQGGASLSLPPRPLPPPVPVQKTWMDKVADAILGSDPSAVGPEQKYALICARCHAHNGLALKEEFNEIQYICPHCGQYNSRRPSSAPVSSPFNPSSRINTRSNETAPETPTRPSKTLGSAAGSSRLKLRADEPEQDRDEDDDDDEDRPPSATLQEEGTGRRDSHETMEANIDTPETPRDARLKSLRARKSQTKGSDSMDLDDD